MPDSSRGPDWNLPRRAAVWAAVALYFLWIYLNQTTILATPDDQARFLVATLFAGLVLFRRKRAPIGAPPLHGRISLAGAGGALLMLAGMVFDVHQAEWLGLMLLLYACLRWALPARSQRDLRIALIILYWVHPLPGQVLGPLQLLMQRLSVWGAEWVLHAENVRVWADGLILRTGLRAFEVPQICSGMRTAIVVLICVGGGGVLLDMPFLHMAAWAVVGLMQALVLNMFRIAAMVTLSMDKPHEEPIDFLHDTTGIFLLGAIVLIHLEMGLWSWWRRRRYGYHRMGAHSVKRANAMQMLEGLRLPNLLPLIKIGLILALALGTAFALYKRRPSHRAVMIAEVVEAMIPGDLELAERASLTVRRLRRHDAGDTTRHVQILLLQNKYDEALAMLEDVPRPSRDERFVIMRCWALIGAERAEEARGLLAGLPESQKRHPGIAIATAEFAAGQDDAETVATSLVRASQWALLMDRIRALFPYLAARDKWAEIRRVDAALPYRNANLLLIAVTAQILGNDHRRAAQLLRFTPALWQGDPRFAPHLLLLARHDPAGPWRQRYAESFLAYLNRLSADELAGSFEPIFELDRPELAWMAYKRLQSLDSEHPGLAMAVVRFAPQWFRFRRRDLALPVAQNYEAIDLRPFVRFLLKQPMAHPHLGDIPLVEPMTVPDLQPWREARFRDAFIAFASRHAAGRMTPALTLLHVEACEMAGRLDEAHALLDELEADGNLERNELLLRRARLHQREENWQLAYEAVRQVNAAHRLPSAALAMILIDSLMRLDQGLAAMDVANTALLTFTDSLQLRFARASIWEAFGYVDEALFALGPPTPETAVPARARLLAKLGRHAEARQLCQALGLPEESAGGSPISADVFPAEMSLVMLKLPQPEDAERAAMLADLQARLQQDESPFMRGLHERLIAWYSDPDPVGSLDLRAWTDIGRDGVERAAALHRLGLMLVRADAHQQALKAIVLALAELPKSEILWRLRVALSDGDRAVLNDARRACPSDPELWLAQFVVNGRANRHDANARALRAALNAKRFSPATFMRAADFLLRGGQVELADTAARYAMEQNPTFLPACVTALRCALALNDDDQALRCAAKAADLAPDPWPYRKLTVMLGMAHGTAGGLIPQLHTLQERFPDEAEWSMRLGSAYFEYGDMPRSWQAFQRLVPGQLAEVPVAVLLQAAEAARRSEATAAAIGILRHARERDPENVHALNNLIFVLSGSSNRLAEASSLVAELARLAPESPAALDTIARVYQRAGDLDKASAFIDQALARRMDTDARTRTEVTLNAAWIALASDDLDRAESLLARLRKESHDTALADSRMRVLVEALETRRRKMQR